MPASELPGQAVSARDVLQAVQSSRDPQSVLSNGLPAGNGSSADKTAERIDNTMLAATGVAAAGAGALALAKRASNFKGVDGGDHVYTAAKKLQAEADRTGRAQKFEFNGKSGATLVAKPGDSVEKILDPYVKKHGTSVESLVKEGKADAFKLANNGHAEKAVDDAFRKGVNEHLLKETGSKAVQLKPGQTLSALDGKVTGNVMKGAREAGDAAVERLRSTTPKSTTSTKAPQTPSVDATYRKAVNEHLLTQTGDKSIKLKAGQTLSALDGKVTGNVMKGAREAGYAAVEALPKPANTATAAVKGAETSAAKALPKTGPSMMKIGGRALVVGAVAMDAVELSNAHQADKARGDGKSTEVKATAASVGLSWGGAIAGAKVGAATAAKFGLIAGPKGAAVAGVVGGLIGAVGGAFAGDAAGDAIRAADAGA